jgi:HSP20 family molecular chaperone IbpA
MQRVTYDLMLDRVRELYQAVTGASLPERRIEGNATVEEPQILRRFAELEATGRLIPGVQERVAPFGFTPLVDVIDVDGELMVELSAPGVVRDEIHVEAAANLLVVTGVRRELPGGRRLVSELPRGPFRRVILLPEEVTAEPRVEVDGGLVRITLRKAVVGGSVAQA